MKKTFTGHQGLQMEEGLIFETSCFTKTGVDFDDIPNVLSYLNDCASQKDIALPGLSEPETMRHYVRLSQKNHSIDSNLYPLGSCTMKHNPRINEKIVRLGGFMDIHPLQPQSTVQGALELMDCLAEWLKTLTGMPCIALSPKAGAHGELCGMMAIRVAIRAKGESHRRKRVLVPESAHGTNPATAALLNFVIDEVAVGSDGCIDMVDLKRKMDHDVAAIMLTNPNTCGLFESDIVEISHHVHAVGGYVYCDGANFNALVGRVCLAELGIDAMHINLHKTFSTPHGGGGPGAGPTVLSERLSDFAPLPYVIKNEQGWQLIEHDENAIKKPFGRMVAFHGQMGMFVRALVYMMSHGADGLRQVAEDAVLNANYILASLKDVMTTPFEGTCMHEVVFDDHFLDNTGITTLDFAKAMIDEGYHPMTIYFPLIVQGAMLIEPTETESKESLDIFIGTLRDLVARAQSGDEMLFISAPVFAPCQRLDETRAARQLLLRWCDSVE